MTYERRDQILSKEVLTISDIQELFDVNYDEAAKKIRDIKRQHDSLKTQGKIHVIDYMRYFGVPETVIEKRYQKMEAQQC